MEEADSISVLVLKVNRDWSFGGEEVPRISLFSYENREYSLLPSAATSRQPLSSFIRGNLSEAFDLAPPPNTRRETSLFVAGKWNLPLSRWVARWKARRDFQVQTQFPRGSSLTFNRRLMSANGRATATKFLGKEKGGEGSDNDDETKSIPAHKGNSV